MGSKKKPKRPTWLRRNPFAVELWSPKYRQRIVTDKRKAASKLECRTLYADQTQHKEEN
jgi:hypothetical protein